MQIVEFHPNGTNRYFKDSNLEAGHVSCDAPERRVDDHIVGLRHAEVWETERAFEKMAVRARSLCAALTASCLSYQPLSRIWCVISPLIMPLLRSNYFPFMFSQNVQEESIPNILHLSLSSNINSMYRCEAVLCNSYSAWTTWERNSRQLLFFSRTVSLLVLLFWNFVSNNVALSPFTFYFRDEAMKLDTHLTLWSRLWRRHRLTINMTWHKIYEKQEIYLNSVILRLLLFVL